MCPIGAKVITPKVNVWTERKLLVAVTKARSAPRVDAAWLGARLAALGGGRGGRHPEHVKHQVRVALQGGLKG